MKSIGKILSLILVICGIGLIYGAYQHYQINEAVSGILVGVGVFALFLSYMLYNENE